MGETSEVVFVKEKRFQLLLPDTSEERRLKAEEKLISKRARKRGSAAASWRKYTSARSVKV
jgi:hypothetical protein